MALINYEMLLQNFIAENVPGFKLELESVPSENGYCCRAKLGCWDEVSDILQTYEKAVQVICAKLLTILEVSTSAHLSKLLGPTHCPTTPKINQDTYNMAPPVAEKNSRQILNEFLQSLLKQSPSIKYYRVHKYCIFNNAFSHQCLRFAYKIVIENAHWYGTCSNSPFIAKDEAAKFAYNELKKFDSENKLRLHLGMPEIKRNPQVEVIRQQLKLICHQIRQHCNGGPL